MPGHYLKRINWKVDLCQKHGLLKDGDKVIELGTGWVHWEALTLRLFFEVEAVLYDVWDNRQLPALKSYIQQVGQAFESGYKVDGVDMDRARTLIRAIAQIDSFDDLYKLLGFRYVVDSKGSLDMLTPGSFDLIVSAGVFEHVFREILPSFTDGWARLLRPGGAALHRINIADHLSLYDQTMSPKQYLSFSEPVWKGIFENDVQYINRLQKCEWIALFQQAGLEVVDEQGDQVDIGSLKIAKRFAGMSPSDLQCTGLEVVLRKAK